MRGFIFSIVRMKSFAVAMAITAALSVVGVASATAPYDLSGVSSSFTDEVTNAVTTALPIGGAIMALFVGWKVLRRIVRG